MRTAFVACMLLALAPAASADPKPVPAPRATEPAGTEAPISGDCARARAHNKTCVLDMGGETVDGDVAKNTGLDTTIATFSTHGSLIHIRRDFLPQIVKTAEDL